MTPAGPKPKEGVSEHTQVVQEYQQQHRRTNVAQQYGKKASYAEVQPTPVGDFRFQNLGVETPAHLTG